MNFRWECTVDYDEIMDPECDHDYCSCRELENLRVVSVDVRRIVSSIVSDLKLNDKKRESMTDRYAVDRIVRHFKMWDASKYEATKEHDYYGEEVGMVTFRDWDNVSATIKQCLALKSITEKVRFLLRLEYGYLLPKLEKVEFHLVEVEIDQIRKGQETYGKKINAEANYDGYELPVAVVDQNLSIIDGYHRVASAKPGKVYVFRASDEE